MLDYAAAQCWGVEIPVDLDSTFTTHAISYATAAHLADSFLSEVRACCAGTRLSPLKKDVSMGVSQVSNAYVPDIVAVLEIG